MGEELDDLNGNDGSQEDGDKSAERPAWLAQLPDSYKENETLSQFKTIGDLGSKFLELDGKTKSYIKPLGEKPTPEEVSEYRKSIGVPEKADGYKIERPETLPEGMVIDELLESKFKEIAHKNNFTPNQVTELAKMHSEYMINIHNDVMKGIKDNRDKATDTLKTIWKGNSYKENTEKAVRSFYKFLENSDAPKEFGGKEGIKTWVEQNGFGDDPVMVWFFSKTFDLIGDDKFIKGSPSGAGGGDVLDKMFPSMAK